MRNVVAFSIMAILVVIIVVILFAPITPYEQLVAAQIPPSSGGTNSYFCRTTGGCGLVSANEKQVWIKSYGSLGFQLFGVGVAPFQTPTTITIGNVTNQFVFNSTGFVTESFAHPSSMKDEPVPLITAESATLEYGPLQATGLSLRLVNHGMDENATVFVNPTNEVVQAETKELDAGRTITYDVGLWESTAIMPGVGDHVALEIDGLLCYEGAECYSYAGVVTVVVAAKQGNVSQPTINGVAGGNVWLVGAQSNGYAASNGGVRSRIDVISTPTTGALAFWVSDGMSNHLWGQVGYSVSGGGPPIGFYQVWNLTSNTLLASGTTAVSLGNHTFVMQEKQGTVWVYAIDGAVFGTYDMGATMSSATLPVYALAEEQGNAVSPLPRVSFAPAIEYLDPFMHSWNPAPVATVYGYGWGVEGNSQNGNLGANQMVVGGNLPAVAPGSSLWGASSSTTPAADIAVASGVPASTLEIPALPPLLIQEKA
jgi:hypothetical protein